MKISKFVSFIFIFSLLFLVGCKPSTENNNDNLDDENPGEEIPTEEDETLLAANAKFLEVKTLLDASIPNELYDNYTFNNFYDDSDVSVIWLSSNAQALTRTGIVNRQSEDVNVTVTAKLKCLGIDYTYTKDIVVKALELRDLSLKKVTSAYLYTGVYRKIAEEDYEKIDIINLSFASISNGVINTSSIASKIVEVSSLRNYGIRVCLSIGGWGADGFSDAVLTKESRTKFITSIVNALILYKFSGVDLDWEYPTSTAGNTIVARPEDKQNFTLFLKELREALDEVNEDYLLTIAVPGTSYGTKYYELATIHQYLDYINLMTYDLLDYQDNETTKHHTSLYNSVNNTSYIKAGVDAYKAAGIPSSKLIIGAAFYGHYGYVSESPSGNGMGKTTTTSMRDAINYTEIYNTYLSNPENEDNVYFDENAKATWYYDGNIFISYDDPVSLTYKCEYVETEELAGIMFWQYGGDQTGTLLDAIYKAFNK